MISSLCLGCIGIISAATLLRNKDVCGKYLTEKEQETSLTYIALAYPAV